MTVESDTGAMTVRLKLDPRQRRDVCAREMDAGGGAVHYDTPVRLA